VTTTRGEVGGAGARRTGAGVVAVLLGALGDSVLTAPSLAALRAAEGPLEVWGPARARLEPLRAPRGPAERVRAWPEAALALWGDAPPPPDLLGGRRLVAFCGPGPLADGAARAGGVAVAPPRAGEPLGAHAGEVLAARLAAATGLEAAGPPTLRPLPGDAARGRALAGAGAYVVCHPGSGGRAKRWPPAAFAAALAPGRLPVVVVTGPAEREWPLTAGLPVDARRLAGPPIADLLALLAGARACVGCDSGPTHLAAALGVPTVGVFGPTDPAEWGPRGRGLVRVVGGRGRFPPPADVTAALGEIGGLG